MFNNRIIVTVIDIFAFTIGTFLVYKNCCEKKNKIKKKRNVVDDHN